jgi:hypothetical protein
VVNEWSFQEAKDLQKISTVLRINIEKFLIKQIKLNINYFDSSNEVKVLFFEMQKEVENPIINVESFVEELLTQLDVIRINKKITHINLTVINPNFSLLSLGIKERYFTREKSIKLKHKQKLKHSPFLKLI